MQTFTFVDDNEDVNCPVDFKWSTVGHIWEEYIEDCNFKQDFIKEFKEKDRDECKEQVILIELRPQC